MTDPRSRIVGEGYDAMADTWEEWVRRIGDDPRATWLDDLVTRLPEGARVVELGARMFFSSFPPEVNSRLLHKAEFELERDEVVTIREPEGEVQFQWVLARR